MATIEVRRLTKRFGEQAAVDDLSFEVQQGKIVGFLGPNGAGKTTTFRMLVGLVKPTSGEALIDGRRYHDLDNPRRTIGALLESSGFHPGRSGRNHLRILARASGIADDRVDHVLDQVDLTDAADKRVGGYSLGMRQRLGLASAALGDPRILLLDEPANGLDPEGMTWLRTTLRRMADEGRTIVISSHVLSEVAQTVDDVVVIAKGQLQYSGTLKTLIDEDGSLEQAFIRLTKHHESSHPASEPATAGAARIRDHFSTTTS